MTDGTSSSSLAARLRRLQLVSVCVALASVALGVVACEGAQVKVPVAPERADDDEDGDVDDDNDETPVPCGDASMCRGEERICHRGFCVECVVDDDCRDDQVCDRVDFDCEGARAR